MVHIGLFEKIPSKLLDAVIERVGRTLTNALSGAPRVLSGHQCYWITMWHVWTVTV